MVIFPQNNALSREREQDIFMPVMYVSLTKCIDMRFNQTGKEVAKYDYTFRTSKPIRSEG